MYRCLRPFQVREITATYTRREFKWKAEAILALQEMAEAYLVGLFEDACVDTYLVQHTYELTTTHGCNPAGISVPSMQNA